MGSQLRSLLKPLPPWPTNVLCIPSWASDSPGPPLVGYTGSPGQHPLWPQREQSPLPPEPSKNKKIILADAALNISPGNKICLQTVEVQITNFPGLFTNPIQNQSWFYNSIKRTQGLMQSGRAAQAQGQLGEAISLPNWEVAGRLPGWGRAIFRPRVLVWDEKQTETSASTSLMGFIPKRGDRRQARKAAGQITLLSDRCGTRGAGQAQVSRRRCGRVRVGGRLVFAGLANLLPGAGLPPPGGGALFPLVRRRPVGARLASAAWAASFLQGFCGVARSGTRTAQSTFCSVLACFIPAVRWFWVGYGRGQISDGKELASFSSGHGGNEALPCRVS